MTFLHHLLRVAARLLAVAVCLWAATGQAAAAALIVTSTGTVSEGSDGRSAAGPAALLQGLPFTLVQTFELQPGTYSLDAGSPPDDFRIGSFSSISMHLTVGNQPALTLENLLSAFGSYSLYNTLATLAFESLGASQSGASALGDVSSTLSMLAGSDLLASPALLQDRDFVAFTGLDASAGLDVTDATGNSVFSFFSDRLTRVTVLADLDDDGTPLPEPGGVPLLLLGLGLVAWRQRRRA